ncbi:AMP-binding protein [Nocardioides sp. LHG3406-4]|uniref:AMP-binding protein n=1 Tax=Nocardioides sp. LHG3406-4 TaxID=2804575 RepID=UPI003CF2D555
MQFYEPRERTIGRILADKASRVGDKPCLDFLGRGVWTYAEVDAITNSYAEGFRQHGVVRGDRVAFVMGNCPELLFSLWGLGKLGAIGVPLNTAAKSDLLVYFLRQSESMLVCTEPEREERVRAAAAAAAGAGLTVLMQDELTAFGDLHAAPPAAMSDVQASDPHLIMYTSGTTGPSKGVVSPHSQGHAVGHAMAVHCGYRPDERLYTCLPLFHANALWFTVYAGLWAEGTVIVSRGFSARQFWTEVRESRATQFNALGAMANIIWQQPRSELDRQHQVRTAMIVPLSTDLAERFDERYGIRVTSVYAMTENCAITVLGIDDPVDKTGSAGRVTERVEVRVVDDDGYPAEAGAVGEFSIRPNEPGSFMLGYYNMAAETVQATQDLWFRTGDRGWIDEDGYLYFSDRKKEAIRRRGENISAYEVEVVLAGHPDVVEAAAVPVPSELGEDEVMAYVVPRPGSTIDYAELIAYCSERMAYFMVPRYLEQLPELPKTASQKIEKYKLMQAARERLDQLWDREVEGIQVQR